MGENMPSFETSLHLRIKQKKTQITHVTVDYYFSWTTIFLYSYILVAFLP